MKDYDQIREERFREQRRMLFVRDLKKILPVFFVFSTICLISIISLNKNLQARFIRGSIVANEVMEEWTPKDMVDRFQNGILKTKSFSNEFFYSNWKIIGEIVEITGDTVIAREPPLVIQKMIDGKKKIDLFKVWTSKVQIKTKKDQKYKEFIELNYEYAVNQMLKTGFPASVILAQGLCESDAGTSDLFIRTNNTFCIKCKNVGGCSDWIPREGAIGCESWSDDDDCDQFCIFPDVESSFIAHSVVLANPRYRKAFMYEVSDILYKIDKSWYGVTEAPYYACVAAMVKDGGYATNLAYHYIISGIVDDRELWRIDFAVLEMVSKQ